MPIVRLFYRYLRRHVLRLLQTSISSLLDEYECYGWLDDFERRTTGGKWPGPFTPDLEREEKKGREKQRG